MKKLFLVLTLLLASVVFVAPAHAQGKAFTAEELATFDGKDGRKAYYAYEGKVYDVTGSKLWEQGQHFGLQAGTDLTGKMDGAPHGTEVFAGFEVVGTFGVAATVAPAQSPAQSTQPQVQETAKKEPWYMSRFKIAGFSLVGFTGILLGVVFVLNFATCFALPWSKLPLPWKGSRIGPDGQDSAPVHMNWASIHKYFAWGTVIIGMIHGILGLLQVLFGIYL